MHTSQTLMSHCQTCRFTTNPTPPLSQCHRLGPSYPTDYKLHRVLEVTMYLFHHLVIIPLWSEVLELVYVINQCSNRDRLSRYTLVFHLMD